MQQQQEYQTGRDLVAYSPSPHQMQRGGGMLMPLAGAGEAAAAIAAYEELKSAIARPDDIQMYQGRPFLKKTFWRRVAACFGLSLELVSEERERDEKGQLAYKALYRAVAPNGRSMIADGYCSRSEKGHGDWPEHTVRATAHTRAKNRAISDLVGGGEVSADELQEDEASTAAVTSANVATEDPWEELRQRALKLGANEAQWLATKSKFKTLPKVRKAIELKEQQAKELQTSVQGGVDASVDAVDDEDTVVDDDGITFTVDGDDPDAPIEHDLRGLKMAGAH